MQAVEDDANRLPPELMRRYEVVVRPRQKHKAIKLRDVSAAHIGKLVRVQARPLHLRTSLTFTSHFLRILPDLHTAVKSSRRPLPVPSAHLECCWELAFIKTCDALCMMSCSHCLAC